MLNKVPDLQPYLINHTSSPYFRGEDGKVWLRDLFHGWQSPTNLVFTDDLVQYVNGYIKNQDAVF